MSTDPLPSSPWQRAAIGVIGVLCIAAGIGLSFTDNTSESLRGILVRVGLILAVTWLAFPQLKKVTPMQTAGAFLLVIGMLVLAASRPGIFRIFGSLVAIGLAIHWVSKWLSVKGKKR